MPTREQRLVQTGEYYKRLALEAGNLLMMTHPPEVRARVLAGYMHCLTTEVLRIALLDDSLFDDVREAIQAELDSRLEDIPPGANTSV